MRELDVLLRRYLDNRYAAASETRKSTFRAFLELPDPDLGAYLLQGVRPESQTVAALVEDILRGDSGGSPAP